MAVRPGVWPAAWSVVLAIHVGVASCAQPGAKRGRIPESESGALEILVDDTPPSKDGDSQQPQGFPAATEPIRRGACGIVVAVSMEAMFEPEGIRTVQRKLVQRGLLKPEELVAGELDESTLQAISELQKTHGLPVVGVPTYATLRLLGIQPTTVLRTGQPNCEEAT